MLFERHSGESYDLLMRLLVISIHSSSFYTDVSHNVMIEVFCIKRCEARGALEAGGMEGMAIGW